MGYIAQTKDYWIAPNAVYITLNALGEANRIQGSVASGTSIMCWIDGIDGLGYTNGHEYNTWPISLSPSFFNDNDPRYVYCAIPRTASIGTQAVIVFPSEKLDIYGVNAGGEQIGSVNYYYIFLQGVISAPSGNPLERGWTAKITDWGQLDTAGGRDAKRLSSEWYEYSLVSEVVTLLKEIKMHTTSWFANLRLGGDRHNLTGVATASTADDFIDSDELVATPSYINARSLSKTHEDVAAAKITFQEGLESKSVKVTGSNGTTPDTDNITQKEVGLDVTHSGVIGGILRVAKSLLTKTIQSLNFSGGDSLTGTGWQLTDDYGNGRSRLVVDDAVFRGKVTLNELEVRKLMAMGGNYVFSPAASVIEEVDYYGYVVVPGEQEPAIELLGYEYIKVPWVLRLIPLSLRGRYLSKKKWVRSTMSQDDYARVVFYRCWLKADDGSTQTINTWRIGMLARCQTFDASQIENGTHEGTYSEAGGQWTGKNVTNKLYWRAVTAAAQGVDKNNYDGKSVVLDDGRKHNYIDLSNGYQGNMQLYLDGSDHVSAGDHIVCFGDWKDANLSHFVTIETIGDDAPAVKEFRGVGYTDGASIDWSLDGKCKTKISPVAGSAFYAPHFYIEANGSVRDVATFMVSTDGILAEVKSVQANGKNLLTGVLTGDGWTDDTGAAAEISDDYVIHTEESELWSPDVDNSEHRTRTLTFYSLPNIATQMDEVVEIHGEGVTYATYVGVVSGDMITVGSDTYVRYQFKVESQDDEYSLHIVPTLMSPYILFPQLEDGEDATVFDAGGKEMSSRIRQTADEIEAKVGKTGVDITNGLIKLIANKTGFYGLNNNTPSIVVSVDSNNMPHLIFKDPNGNDMYDLGYTGLRQLVNNGRADEYSGTLFTCFLVNGSAVAGDDGDIVNGKALYGDSYSGANNPMTDLPSWFFTEGFTIGTGGQRIYNWGGAYIDGAYLADDVPTQTEPGQPVGDGWYFLYVKTTDERMRHFRLIKVSDGFVAYNADASVYKFLGGSSDLVFPDKPQSLEGRVGYRCEITDANGYDSVGYVDSSGTLVGTDWATIPTA